MMLLSRLDGGTHTHTQLMVSFACHAILLDVSARQVSGQVRSGEIR